MSEGWGFFSGSHAGDLFDVVTGDIHIRDVSDKEERGLVVVGMRHVSCPCLDGDGGVVEGDGAYACLSDLLDLWTKMSKSLVQVDSRLRESSWAVYHKRCVSPTYSSCLILLLRGLRSFVRALGSLACLRDVANRLVPCLGCG